MAGLEQRAGGALLFSESGETLAELLSAVSELRSGINGPVTTLAVGPEAEKVAEECLARGADEVLLFQSSPEQPIGVDGFVTCLREAVRAVDPDTILLIATRTGADAAARLAQVLAVPCASECLSLRLEEDGGLAIERRVYGGRFVARQVLVGRPRIATIPPNRFAKAERRANPELHGSRPSPRIQELAVSLPRSRVRTRATSPRVRSDVDVSKADVIVAAGRGVKKAEDLAMLEKLARTLGGVLAASRPLTGDLDWLPVDRRIGLSGQTVKPHLYIACGISGQIEHIVGMKGARTVVAVNSDPKAPIHAEADYSVVGDLYEIVPAILAAVEAGKPLTSTT